MELKTPPTPRLRASARAFSLASSASCGACSSEVSLYEVPLMSPRIEVRLGMHTGYVSEELVQAAKAAAELEPAVEAFAEATGSLEPVREATGWLSDLIRYKRLPHQAKLLMKAAEKVKETGLPTHAVSDKLLRSVLEDGPLEHSDCLPEDPQRIGTQGSRIARASTFSSRSRALRHGPFRMGDHPRSSGPPRTRQLGSAGSSSMRPKDQFDDGGSVSEHEPVGFKFTELGWAFAAAFNSP